ncbi:MAG: hypothetical protein K2X47_06670 [Bdellovibrionales bacterium]|nr:hypothetical protein [Bdellovibrionales bacterium]
MTAAFRIITALVLVTNASGCVTVSVGEKKGKKAEQLEVSVPPPPFKELDTSDADRAWQNTSTGSSIAYTSECFGSDPSLVSIQQTVLQGLSDVFVESETKLSYNSREALETQATGTVDGVKVKIRFLAFKKNNCNFTLNYFAMQKFFEKDLSAYQQFKEKFRAP